MELWLNYKDEFGEQRRVRTIGENFVVGRTPDNDLSIARSELSRRHAEINRFGDVFVVSDCNSSNGTTLNGRALENPAPLKNGDRINLGGAVEITIELIDRHSNARVEASDAAGFSNAASPAPPDSPNQNLREGVGSSVSDNAPVSSDPAPPISSSANSSSAAAKRTSLGILFIVAPVSVFVILVLAGGLFLLFGNRKSKDAPTENSDAYVYSTKRDTENKRKTPSEDKTPTPAKTKETPGASETPANSAAASATPLPASGELDRVERGALPFMRRIAVRDDTYVFTQKQLGEINDQIKIFKSSSALRDNLKAVQANRTKFEELAKSKGLKPQFLAVAALAKIGAQNQNPLAVAQTMLPILGELKITLGNELADENLLVVAAYDLGEQKKFRALQSTLEALSKQTTGVASNKIRTIWYLRERGKITDAEYNFALRFLAIGAITQNPKDFGVDSEAVTFD